MKTKNKALLLTLCAMLLVAASIFGTVAYLTSKTENVVNTFTVGQVKITLDEAEVDADGKPVQGAARVQKNAYKLIAKKYADNKVENIITGTDDSIWWVSQPSFDEAANTVTYTFVYKNESHTDELGKRIWTKADGKDLVLFNKIVMPGEVTNEELAGVADTKITVVGEAIQAEGFETEAAAWAAFDAKKQQKPPAQIRLSAPTGAEKSLV